jgi:hypothetical protein
MCHQNESHFIGDWDNVLEFNLFAENELKTLKADFALKTRGEIQDRVNESNSEDGKHALCLLNKFIFEDVSMQGRLKSVSSLASLWEYLLKR